MILATDIEITIGQAFALSGVAMLIIMAVLTSIMGLIHLVALILKKLDEHSAKKQKETLFSEDESLISAKSKKQYFDNSLKLVNVEDREAAMIMAIVADNSGIPLNELRFISIERTDLGGQYK